MSLRDQRVLLVEAISLFQDHSSPTVRVTCVLAGVDSVWEQEKPEARKMPENAAESHTSGAALLAGVALRLACNKNQLAH